MQKANVSIEFNDPDLIKKRLRFTQKARGQSILNKTQFLSSTKGTVRSFVSTKSIPGIFAKICSNINNLSSDMNNSVNNSNTSINNTNIEEIKLNITANDDDIQSDGMKNIMTRAISSSSSLYKKKQKFGHWHSYSN